MHRKERKFCFNKHLHTRRHDHSLTQYDTWISKCSLFSNCQIHLPSCHNLEPTATGKYVLKLNESWNFQIHWFCVVFAWRAWMKGGKERWWWRGISLYRCGHVENEEYWDVCNGTFIQGRFVWSSPQKEMLHFNCAVRNERGVCGVPPHIWWRNVAHVFKQSLFSLTGIVNYTVLLFVLEACGYSTYGNYLKEEEHCVSPYAPSPTFPNCKF